MPAASQLSQPVELFFSYSSKDKELRDQLATQLAMLKHEGIIRDWHDRRITAGREWRGEISAQLESADIVLLLVSPDFLASKYCYGIEVARAMDRHEAGEAYVIPVIVRPCEWQRAPFSKLQALPTGAVPITRWPDRDEAFLSVAEGIRRAVEELLSNREWQRKTSDETAPRSTQSPIPHPPFFGFVARRDAQGRDIVGRLKEELAPGRNRSATLSGPGGIGKTTLAAEAARELQEAYRNRIVWDSAEGRADFTLLSLLDDIATQLGRAEMRTLAPAAKDEQVRALVAEAPALVALDNYESIAAEEKKRIEAWFKSAHCSALFTSRHKIDDTVLVQVSAMSREEAEEFLVKIIEQTQDAQIFTADARRRIYETAEANPFVMQWVVGQIDEAQAPDEVLEELSKGEGDDAARVFDRSYNLLDDDGRDTLLALSLFAPSATRAALAEVAGFDEERVKEAVKNLNRLWLVKLMDEHRRFAVEGLTRSMAAARLSKDPRAGEFRRRFVAYFLRYAVERQEQTPENYDALEDEKDNLLGASEAAFASEDWQSVMQMAYILAADGMLVVRGYWDDAVRLSEEALQAARSSQNAGLVAGLSHNLAVMYQNRGEFDDARRFYGESIEAARMIGNRPSIASTLHNLAAVAQDTNELDEARSLYNESLAIKREVGDQSGIAATMHQLGLLAQTQGDLEEAQRFYNESLEINRKLGDQRRIATTLHNLGIIAQRQEMYEEARRLYNESLNVDKRLGNQYGIAVTIHNMGMLAQEEGALDEARRLYGESLEIKQRLGDQLGMAATLRNLAAIAQQSGDVEEARRLLSEILVIEERARKAGSADEYLRGTDSVEMIQLELDHERAINLMHAGSWREARDILQANRERLRAIKDKRRFAETLLALAQTEHAIGDLEKARWTYKDALDLFRNLDERLAAVTSGYLARLELQTGLAKDALTHLREAEDYFKGVDNTENLKIIRQLIGAAEEIATQQSDHEMKTSVFMKKRRPRK